MRIYSFFALLALLSGCTRPDVQACEKYIQAQLRSPSTYQQVKVTTYDSERLTPLEFQKETQSKEPKSTMEKAQWSIYEKAQLKLRTLLIEYDAENAFGTPVRNIEMCGFRIVGNKLESPASLTRSTNNAIINKRLESSGFLAEDIKPIGGAKSGKFNCCL